jgi:hypothetical protein
VLEPAVASLSKYSSPTAQVAGSEVAFGSLNSEEAINFVAVSVSVENVRSVSEVRVSAPDQIETLPAAPLPLIVPALAANATHADPLQ